MTKTVPTKTAPTKSTETNFCILTSLFIDCHSIVESC